MRVKAQLSALCTFMVAVTQKPVPEVEVGTWRRRRALAKYIFSAAQRLASTWEGLMETNRYPRSSVPAIPQLRPTQSLLHLPGLCGLSNWRLKQGKLHMARTISSLQG
jgi:hypothetical protein